MTSGAALTTSDPSLVGGFVFCLVKGHTRVACFHYIQHIAKGPQSVETEARSIEMPELVFGRKDPGDIGDSTGRGVSHIVDLQTVTARAV